jgi:hypothetical protein
MLIGVSGYLGSGKSEIGVHLVTAHGFTVVSPIDPCKRLGVELGFTSASMFGPSSAREETHPSLCRPDGSPLTARGFLDRVSAAVRAECPTILLAAAMSGDGDRVNESVRKRIEYDAIRAAGGKLIKRKGGTRRGDEYDEVGDMPDHMFDAVLPRFDTLDQLHATLDVLVAGWRSELSR